MIIHTIMLLCQGIYPLNNSRKMLAWFEHGRWKECVWEEFPYVRKLCKDYRLEAKWEENVVKVFTLRTVELRGRALQLKPYYKPWRLVKDIIFKWHEPPGLSSTYLL